MFTEEGWILGNIHILILGPPLTGALVSPSFVEVHMKFWSFQTAVPLTLDHSLPGTWQKIKNLQFCNQYATFPATDFDLKQIADASMLLVAYILAWGMRWILTPVDRVPYPLSSHANREVYICRTRILFAFLSRNKIRKTQFTGHHLVLAAVPWSWQ